MNSPSSNSGSSNNEGSPVQRFRRLGISTPGTSPVSISNTPNKNRRTPLRFTQQQMTPSPIAAHALNFGSPMNDALLSPMVPQSVHFNNSLSNNSLSNNSSSMSSPAFSAISATSPHMLNMNASAPTTPVRAPTARRRLNFGAAESPASPSNSYTETPPPIKRSRFQGGKSRKHRASKRSTKRSTRQKASKRSTKKRHYRRH